VRSEKQNQRNWRSSLLSLSLSKKKQVAIVLEEEAGSVHPQSIAILILSFKPITLQPSIFLFIYFGLEFFWLSKETDGCDFGWEKNRMDVVKSGSITRIDDMV
jgi:hypothetical protein